MSVPFSRVMLHHLAEQSAHIARLGEGENERISMFLLPHRIPSLTFEAPIMDELYALDTAIKEAKEAVAEAHKPPKRNKKNWDEKDAVKAAEKEASKQIHHQVLRTALVFTGREADEAASYANHTSRFYFLDDFRKQDSGKFRFLDSYTVEALLGEGLLSTRSHHNDPRSLMRDKQIHLDPRAMKTMMMLDQAIGSVAEKFLPRKKSATSEHSTRGSLKKLRRFALWLVHDDPAKAKEVFQLERLNDIALAPQTEERTAEVVQQEKVDWFLDVINGRHPGYNKGEENTPATAKEIYLERAKKGTLKTRTMSRTAYNLMQTDVGKLLEEEPEVLNFPLVNANSIDWTNRIQEAQTNLDNEYRFSWGRHSGIIEIPLSVEAGEQLLKAIDEKLGWIESVNQLNASYRLTLLEIAELSVPRIEEQFFTEVEIPGLTDKEAAALRQEREALAERLDVDDQAMESDPELMAAFDRAMEIDAILHEYEENLRAQEAESESAEAPERERLEKLATLESRHERIVAQMLKMGVEPPHPDYDHTLNIRVVNAGVAVEQEFDVLYKILESVGREPSSNLVRKEMNAMYKGMDAALKRNPEERASRRDFSEAMKREIRNKRKPITDVEEPQETTLNTEKIRRRSGGGGRKGVS